MALDIRGGGSGGAAFPKAVGTKGTIDVNGTPGAAADWGLVINKNSAARVGQDSGTVRYDVNGDPRWGTGMDVSDQEFVVAFDFKGSGVAGATSGDVWRMAPGGATLFSRNAGPVNKAHRLQIVSDSKDDPSTADTLYLQVGNGSPATDFIRGQYDAGAGGVERFNIDKTGRAGFGSPYTGWSTVASIESKRGAVIWSSTVAEDPFLMLASSAGANPRTYIQGIDQSTGTFYVKDNATANWVFTIARAATSATLTILSGGVVNFGAAPTTTTAPTAGAAGALPATPVGYFTVAIGGTNRKVAYY